MPTVYLGVNQNFSASGVTAQGSIDSTSGPTVGTILPCPGVFPCTLRAKSAVKGSSAVVVEAVYSGPNHIVLKETLHDYIPASGTRIRIENKSISVKVVGGTYTDPLSTLTPVLSPYSGERSISLNGLPAELFAGTSPSTTTTIGGAANNPNDPLNFVYRSDSFQYSFANGQLSEACNILWTGGTTGDPPLAINVSGLRTGSSLDTYNLQAGTLLPVYVPVTFRYPTFTDDEIVDTNNSFEVSRRSASNLVGAANTPQFNCFEATGTRALKASTFGTQSTPNFIRSFCTLETDPNFSYIGTRANLRLFLGAFGNKDDVDATNPDLDWPTEFFQLYYPGSNKISATKPSIGINTNLSSVKINSGQVTASNFFWLDSSPIGTRYSRYADIKATQYGYVLLNEDTRHLEFMFTAHADPWMESAEAQVINKLMHAPPRSADYIAASNMRLGMDPRAPNGTVNTYSLYVTNDSVIRGFFDTDQILHGGGGHIMALGTYNGAIVNGGKVTVWGSNRWGQLVLPEPMRASGVVIVDVAVSNAPPVLSTSSGLTYYEHSIYSEELAEKAARDFNSPTLNATTDIYKFSYPESEYNRYGRHINYTNLPGHVVVVTEQGWVYAWGNNKYYQCEVPDEINLVDSSGNVKSENPTDPIAEVSAGAYHTVARSRNGVVYVWGAGGPWVGQYGRVTTPGDDVRPHNGTALVFNPTNQAVHFGQSLLLRTGTSPAELGGSGYAHLAPPSASPPGLSSWAVETYATFPIYPASNIFPLTKTINGSSVTVGQKTAAGFSVSETTSGSPTRMKGMIAAGAFHTAIIDAQLKIQCVGAGRGGATQPTASPSLDNPVSLVSTAQWGSSYTYSSDSNVTRYSTYPHYCQSLSQYRCPLPANTSTTHTAVALFRHVSPPTAQATNHKSRYFQDLLFKKVICGPFTTHGIIYSVSRGSPDIYSGRDKAYLHGRVVSWGCAFSPRSFQTSGTSSIGILGNKYDAVSNSSSSTYNTDPNSNPAGTLSGMGSTQQITVSVNRMFEIINRTMSPMGGAATTAGIYPTSGETPYLSLVGPPSSNSEPAANPSVGVVGTTPASQGWPVYNTDCPVTISRFKVKDMATCGDFAVYIGFLDTFTRSFSKISPTDTDQVALDSAATFDYQASVFFTGNDAYRDSTPGPWQMAGRFDAISPYAGNIVARRNRVGGASTPYLWPGTSALPMKTRSFHFGPIKRQAAGVVGRLFGDGADRTLEYVLPTTALASANLTVAIVNMDNRPVAWLGHYYTLGTNYQASLDLSLLPSIPIQSFKTGKAHILAVSAGDWPVAVGLGTTAGTPKIVSELGNLLFESVTAQSVAPGLIYGDGNRYYRPVLLAWGAGDGREFGRTLLSLSPAGDGGTGSMTGPIISSSGADSVFGLGFLDTHAVSRYDATYAVSPVQGLAVNTDAWENYYGHYRWNVNSRYDGLYERPNFNSTSSSSAYEAMFGPPGHHAVEALQSLLGFQHNLYPSTFANPALGERGLLNGTSKSAIPSAAFMPFITSASQTGSRARCCVTAAEESTNFESLNSLQEYHSPLGYTQQTYMDFVVDYAAGSMHSAVLFRSSCASWSQINSNAHLVDMNAFSTHFMTDVSGTIPFGQRKVCKLGIVGYGCEGQTAGSARILQDGSVAPLVPRLFGTDAKVYCGDSYTLVTNPIRIVEVSSGNVALTLPDSGAGFTSKTIPISIPSSAYSKRIRGLDVKITVVTSSGTVNLPMSSWDITIPYKQNEWVVFKRLKANLDTDPFNAFIHVSTTAATFRISDRFFPASAYSYTGTYELYDEQGRNPTNSASYSTFVGGPRLKPINTSAAVPALDKSGCYYPVSVDPSTFAVTNETWKVNGTTPAATVLPFNEPIINVIIKDYTSAASYANCSINITLEIEVDAEELPYVLYGPGKAGVWNELPGVSPSFGADISAFDQSADSGTSLKSRWFRNCPCEIDSTLWQRKYPVGYPVDTRFICGTKKYGPSGNRETAAAQVLDITYNTQNGSTLRGPFLKSRISANFFSVFDTIPHRPFLGINDAVSTLNPSMQVLGSNAFISTGSTIELSVPSVQTSSAIAEISRLNAQFFRRLAMTPGYIAVQSGLLTNNAVMYNKTLFPPPILCSANVGMAAGKNLGKIIGLSSTNC